MKKTLMALVLATTGAWAANPDLAKQAAEEAAQPVLPGWGKYFWNRRSIWYIHPPAFDFATVPHAVRYRFSVTDDLLITHEFEAESPTASLRPVWQKIPVGFASVSCYGLDAQHQVCGCAGGPVRFRKNAAFKPGSYGAPKCSYAEAAKRAYDYIFGLEFVKKLVETGKPDFSYKLNCYPSKMNSALIRAALHCAELDPSRKEKMLKIARAAADYMISVAEPDGAPLAGFTPTYAKGNSNYTSGKYAGQTMLDYPPGVGSAWIQLAKVSQDGKYLAAAKKMAESFLRLQGEDGTWPLKLYEKDGKPVTPNRLLPRSVCSFMLEMAEATGDEKYRACADRAFAYIEQGPLKNWNWEGQFEDVEPSKMYANLTKHPACDTAMYLLKRYPKDAARLEQARELLRFAEDQFVVWERPCRADGAEYCFAKGGNSAHRVKNWTMFPTVMEQYEWYMPTDASSAKMIRTYLAYYHATGDALALAKARALGDAYTRVQKESGRIPTQWMNGFYENNVQSDWVNCMIASAAALELLAAEE